MQAEIPKDNLESYQWLKFFNKKENKRETNAHN